MNQDSQPVNNEHRVRDMLRTKGSMITKNYNIYAHILFLRILVDFEDLVRDKKPTWNRNTRLDEGAYGSETNCNLHQLNPFSFSFSPVSIIMLKMSHNSFHNSIIILIGNSL